MQNLNFTPLTRTPSLVRNPVRPGRNESLLRANRESMAHLGSGNEVTTDPKGRILRQLRLNAGLDPSELATRACISLAQLYEIEMGLTTLFYSNSLREQAARRVARLLCTDWQTLATTAAGGHYSSNVVKLQWPAASKVTSAAHMSSPSPNEAEPEGPSPLIPHEEAPPLGLSTPCASTVQTAASHTAEPEKSQPKSRWIQVLTWVFWTALVCAAAAYAIDAWSPYRVIWPWEAWPWALSLPLTF